MIDLTHKNILIIDDDPDCKDEAEKGQQIEAETKRQHDGKSTDQRHRHRDQRDDRRAP